MTWWDLFSARTCPHCDAKIRQPGHGLRRSTCETCHATLPEALALHLDRAMHSRWYLAWWRVAMQALRRHEAREVLRTHATVDQSLATTERAQPATKCAETGGAA